MLVITRKPGQTVLVGQTEIRVLPSRTRGQIRLAITAPRAVVILRGELLDRQPPRGPAHA